MIEFSLIVKKCLVLFFTRKELPKDGIKLFYFEDIEDKRIAFLQTRRKWLCFLHKGMDNSQLPIPFAIPKLRDNAHPLAFKLRSPIF